MLEGIDVAPADLERLREYVWRQRGTAPRLAALWSSSPRRPGGRASSRALAPVCGRTCERSAPVRRCATSLLAIARAIAARSRFARGRRGAGAHRSRARDPAADRRGVLRARHRRAARAEHGDRQDAPPARLCEARSVRARGRRRGRHQARSAALREARPPGLSRSAQPGSPHRSSDGTIDPGDAARQAWPARRSPGATIPEPQSGIVVARIAAAYELRFSDYVRVATAIAGDHERGAMQSRTRSRERSPDAWHSVGTARSRPGCGGR